jgi:hypothetical protein
MSERAPESRRQSGEAADCPTCGRLIRIVNHRGGDGTARRFVKHGPRDAPCPGSGEDAPGWEVNS